MTHICLAWAHFLDSALNAASALAVPGVLYGSLPFNFVQELAGDSGSLPAWPQSRSWLPSMIMKGAQAVKGSMKLEKSSQMDR